MLGDIVKLGTKLRPNLFRQGVKLGASNLLKQGVQKHSVQTQGKD